MPFQRVHVRTMTMMMLISMPAVMLTIRMRVIYVHICKLSKACSWLKLYAKRAKQKRQYCKNKTYNQSMPQKWLKIYNISWI